MDANIPSAGDPVVDYSDVGRDELERLLNDHVRDADKVRRHLQSEIRRHQDTSAQLNLISRVVEHAHFAVMITDADQKLVYVNEAYTRLTGFKASEVIGRTPKVNQSGRHSPLLLSATMERAEQ